MKRFWKQCWRAVKKLWPRRRWRLTFRSDNLVEYSIQPLPSDPIAGLFAYFYGVPVAQISIPLGKKVRVTVTPENTKHEAAPVDGPVLFLSSNPAVAKVVSAPAVPVDPDNPDAVDPLAAYIVATGVGGCTIAITADGDLGPGVRTLTETVLVTVKPLEAASLNATFGDLEDA